LKLEVPKVTNPPKFVADKNELKSLASRKDAKGFYYFDYYSLRLGGFA
jgi:hypothetical protein